MPKLDAFLFFDYKQIEPRFLAYYLHSIQDTKLSDYISAGGKVYDAVIAEYYGRSDISEEEYNEGKRLFLSLMYGGGTPTVIRQFGVDFPTAKQMTDRFHKAWPGIRKLQGAIDAVMQARGYIKTPWGRHLHTVEAHKRLNALMQGSAADLMRYSLVKADKWMKEQQLESHIVSVVHDEIIIDAINEEIPAIVAMMPEIMDFELVSRIVPILTDIEWSTTTWADKVAYEEVQVG